VIKVLDIYFVIWYSTVGNSVNQIVETASHAKSTDIAAMQKAPISPLDSPVPSAEIVSRSDEDFKIQITIPYVHSMLKSEELIQKHLNEAGVKATQEVLGRFDTDGSPIQYGSTRCFSKGKEPKEYQTPYGQTVVDRHVYQTSKGGKTFCPLEHDARIIVTSTRNLPRQCPPNMLTWVDRVCKRI